VRTKHGADRLVRRLSKHRVDAVAMHGNKSQNQRQRALARFERGDVDTLVATDVAARGIDVEDITHVINFDAPGDRDAYVHRIGRTARAGRDGAGVTFVLPEQTRELRRIASDLGLNAEFANAVRGHAETHRAPARHQTRAHAPSANAGSGKRSRGSRRSRSRP
jgi:superfamily II DNA/RNA helicase